MAKGVGKFWSDEGEREYRRVYEEARSLWPSHRVMRVPTDLGMVQVLAAGDGDVTPVVLLHGMSCTSLMWRPNVEALTESRPVYAIDCVADCGGGTQTAPAPDLRALTDNLTQTLTGLGVERAHFVGLSYGAWQAAGMSLHHPDLVASTTLMEPAATLNTIRPAYLLGFAASLVRPSPRRWKHLFASRPADDYIAMLDASRHYRPAAPLPTVLRDAELASIEAPVQVILGDQSTTSDPERDRRRLAEVLPQAKLTVIPGAGHIVSVDAAPAVNALLGEFLD